MRKKPYRRPASSRPQHDRFTTNMAEENPSSFSQHVQTIDEENDQTPNPIQQVNDDKNPNPNPNPISTEEDKGDDLVEQHKPQSDAVDVEEDVDPEPDEEVEGEDEKQIELNAPYVSRKNNKRKKKRKQRLGLEKKLKHEEAEDVQDSPKIEIVDNPQPQNFEKGGDLEGDGQVQNQVKESEPPQKEPQGMSFSPLSSPHVPPTDEDKYTVFRFALDDQPIAPGVSRKTPKKKKMNVRQKARIEKILNLLKENLKPIPFVPETKLDFSKHEQLFKRLGLWDFVNMDFDQDIRSDLIAMLIANYNSAMRYSTVNDVRIKVSRADLARALKLPVKKDKSVSLETSDFDSEALSEESISFIVDFFSNWILLHEDTWIMPSEVLNWDALIRKGQPHKVDWPGLIWYMVEKELKQDPEIGTLYFASHIQCLMKHQRDDLFKRKPLLETLVEVEEDSDLKIGSSKDYVGEEFEDQQTELCLGQNERKEQYEQEDTMEYQESKQEPGGQAQWFLNDNYVNNHCLQRCSMSEAQNQLTQCGIEEVEDEKYDPHPNCSTLGGLASTDPFQEIGTTSIPYSPSFRVPGHSSGDLFQSGIDAHLNPGGMSMLVNSFKREVSHSDIEYHHVLNGHQNHEQMRSDVSPPDFNFYVEQIHCFANKAKEMYEEKEKANLNANMNQELLSDLQHQNTDLINYLQKMKCDLQRKDMEKYKLEGELHVMSSLLEGYRNALKESRRAFSEYRERNPEPEEALYKDAGPGGVVLSRMELERQRLQREQEDEMMRCRLKQLTADFMDGFVETLDEYKYRLHGWEKRLQEVEGKVELYRSISMCKAEECRE